MRVTGITFGLLDAEPGADAEFNRWYDTDHIPENFALPGHCGARRYVATVEDKALRFPTKHPDFQGIGGSYLTTYLLSADDLLLARSTMHDLARKLLGEKSNRMFARVRPSKVHTYRVARAYTRAGYPLALDAVPYVGHLGVYVAVCDPAPGRAAETAAWYDQVHLPEMLQVRGFATGLRVVRELPEEDGRFANIFFLDEDPAEAVTDLNAHIRQWRAKKRLPSQAVGARTAFSSGFHLISPLEYPFLNGTNGVSQSGGERMPSKLSDEQVKARLKSAPGWRRARGQIRKRYEFEDCVKALRFVNKVGKLAEAMDHHPDITINYNKVTLGLSTHSAGGLTELDFGLAAKIEGIPPKRAAPAGER